MSGHTPGPWVIAGDSYGGFNRIWAKVEGELCDVASCVGDGSLTRDEVAANERLISAAPDLLEAARAGGRYSDSLARYQRAGVRGEMVPGTEELERLFLDWHDKTHAAIAKAEGK